MPRRRSVASVEPLVTALLLPLFFAFSGLRTSIQLISTAALWTQAFLILAVAVDRQGRRVRARRTCDGNVVARCGADWQCLLNTRGLVELVVLNIGLDLGILSPVLFSMMVMMALATTLATSPLVSLIKSSEASLQIGSSTAPARGASTPRRSAARL